MEAPILLDVRIGGKGVAPFQGLPVEGGAFSRGVATGLTSDGTVGAEAKTTHSPHPSIPWLIIFHHRRRAARRQEIGVLRFCIDTR